MQAALRPFSVVFCIGFVFLTGCYIGSSERSWSDQPRLMLTAGTEVEKGTYELFLSPHQRKQDGMHVELKEKHYSSGSFKRFETFEGLALEAKDPASDYFVLRGEAGIIHFTGERTDANGRGSYRFEPNLAFQSEAGDLLGPVSTRDLLDMVIAELTGAYIREVQAAGFKVNAREILRLKRHGLQANDIKQFARQGFDAVGMVRLRSHGVTPEYSEEVIALGLTRKAEDITKLRNHGVSAEFIKAWNAAGYEFGVEDLVKLRSHGVNGEFGKAWKEAGYSLSRDELIKARNHGVPAEFPAKFKAAGHSPTPEEIISMRNHGVTPEYYAAVKKSLPELTSSEVTRLRQHGVTPGFVAGLKEAGYNFNPEEITRLRNSGLSVDYAKALVVPGKENLDASALVELRHKGVSAETARKLRGN